MDTNLPPEFQPLLVELAAQPENVHAMWRYAVVLMMIDDEKARVIETRQQGDETHLTVQTLAGERFSIARPAMSEETERVLLEQIRAIVEDESPLCGIEFPTTRGYNFPTNKKAPPRSSQRQQGIAFHLWNAINGASHRRR